jgi:hypothetical protein
MTRLNTTHHTTTPPYKLYRQSSVRALPHASGDRSVPPRPKSGGAIQDTATSGTHTILHFNFNIDLSCKSPLLFSKIPFLCHSLLFSPLIPFSFFSIPLLPSIHLSTPHLTSTQLNSTHLTLPLLPFIPQVTLVRVARERRHIRNNLPLRGVLVIAANKDDIEALEYLKGELCVMCCVLCCVVVLCCVAL